MSPYNVPLFASYNKASLRNFCLNRLFSRDIAPSLQLNQLKFR